MVRKLFGSKSKQKAKTKAEPSENAGGSLKSQARGRPKVEQLHIDVDWFAARMKQCGIKSFAELARSLGIDKAMMSKSLNAQRIFGVKDVVKLAGALKVSTGEIIRRIGYDIPERGVMIVGKITSGAQVSYVASRKGEMCSVTDAPPGAQALAVEGLHGYDGAIVVFVPPNSNRVSAVIVIGQLAIIEADDYLMPFIGTIERGGRGKHEIELLGSGQRKSVEKIHAVSPVVSVHFP